MLYSSVYLPFQSKLPLVFGLICQIFCIDLSGIIGNNRQGSKLRFLSYNFGKFYVTDLGRNKIYIVDEKTHEVRVLGGTCQGPDTFNQPAGVAADAFGNLLVADSKNHRMCAFSSDLNYLGDVQVDLF